MLAVSCSAVILIAFVGYIAVPYVRGAINYVAWRLAAAPEFSQGYATNDGVQIHYTLCGNGPPLLLLHGGLSSTLDWMGEMPALTRSFRVILLDMRGHGKSSFGPEHFTYRLLASDVRAVLDTLDIERADIVGWSDGGNTGLLFAIEYPHRLHRLVVISANFNPDGISAAAFDPIENRPEEIDPFLSRWFHHWQSESPGRWVQLRDRVVAMWRDYPQLTPEALSAVRVPTLVMVGGQDYIELSHAQVMVQALADAELVVIPNVGHAVPRYAARAVTLNIERFLSSE
jgi:pimeloyl-ACP methyl ester carboxylesterase